MLLSYTNYILIIKKIKQHTYKTFLTTGEIMLKSFLIFYATTINKIISLTLYITKKLISHYKYVINYTKKLDNQ